MLDQSVKGLIWFDDAMEKSIETPSRNYLVSQGRDSLQGLLTRPGFNWTFQAPTRARYISISQVS